jgi:hypothetical protein
VKYGLDAVFYWYRLWVLLDKDLREEIDNAQAIVDSTVYIAFGFYLSALVTFFYACIEIFAQTNLPYLSWFPDFLYTAPRLPYVPGPVPLLGLSQREHGLGILHVRIVALRHGCVAAGPEPLAARVYFGHIFCKP